LELAYLSTRALVLLEDEKRDENETRNLADAILNVMQLMKKQRNSLLVEDTATEFGTFFLVLLICWSGIPRPAF
jgi:hypothetical protein